MRSKYPEISPLILSPVDQQYILLRSSLCNCLQPPVTSCALGSDIVLLVLGNPVYWLEMNCDHVPPPHLCRPSNHNHPPLSTQHYVASWMNQEFVTSKSVSVEEMVFLLSIVNGRFLSLLLNITFYRSRHDPYSRVSTSNFFWRTEVHNILKTRAIVSPETSLTTDKTTRCHNQGNENPSLSWFP